MIKKTTTFLILILILLGCQSTPTEIDESLSASEYFQKAQEAVVNRNDFETALLYYQTFKERFPDEAALLIEAEYEIAFIYYKQERYQEAKVLFEGILEAYGTEAAASFYQWPRVLSEKILLSIEEQEVVVEEEAAE